MPEPRDYKVTAVHGHEDKPDKGHGPMRSVYMDLEGEEGRVEWYQKATTAIPNAGDVLFGYITDDPKWGKKFKKEQKGGGGGGGGAYKQTHPVDAARMSRSHAQEMAIRTLELAHSLGVAPALSDVKGIVGAVKTLADAYDKDVRENGVPT